jgi:acyl-CoA reductase-like NAD-dependent aldehyde dehydrogenase
LCIDVVEVEEMSVSEVLRIISPADGSVYFETRFAADDDVDAAVVAARRGFEQWRRTPPAERARMVDNFINAFTSRAEELAQMVAWQIGRPLAQADEAGAFRYMGDFYKASMPRFTEQQTLPSDAEEQRFLRREPLGVNLAICAWNFPVSMVAGIVIAPLLLGNVVIFKHSPQVARISSVLNEAAAATLPPGVFQALNMTVAQAERLIKSGSIDLVNFIGSVRGGLEVRRAAAGAFVHQILELGGKDPAYVRADAQLDRAIPELVWASFRNSGQSCCSVERIYVDASIYDRFVEAFVVATRDLKVGHPIHDNPTIGPVVNASAAQRILAEVNEAVSAGARELVGGPAATLDAPGGAYLAPSVLTNVTHDMRIMREETFGPVAPIMKVHSDAEALKLMNDSRYGLTASIWTADIDRGIELGGEVDTGNFYVNRADYADDYLPWGGVKHSGLGRAEGWTWGDGLTQTKGYYARRFT